PRGRAMVFLPGPAVAYLGLERDEESERWSAPAGAFDRVPARPIGEGSAGAGPEERADPRQPTPLEALAESEDAEERLAGLLARLGAAPRSSRPARRPETAPPPGAPGEPPAAPRAPGPFDLLDSLRSRRRASKGRG